MRSRNKSQNNERWRVEIHTKTNRHFLPTFLNKRSVMLCSVIWSKLRSKYQHFLEILQKRQIIWASQWHETCKWNTATVWVNLCDVLEMTVGPLLSNLCLTPFTPRIDNFLVTQDWSKTESTAVVSVQRYGRRYAPARSLITSILQSTGLWSGLGCSVATFQWHLSIHQFASFMSAMYRWTVVLNFQQIL